MDSIALSAAQQFEIEKTNREIDSMTDLSALRAISKQLLTAWMTQRAATAWAIRQSLLKAQQADG